MENDFENHDQDSISKRTSKRKYKSAILIWPILFITVVIFILSITLPESNRSTKIDINTAIKRIVRIFIPQKRPGNGWNSARVRMAPIESVISTYLLNTGQYPQTLNDLIVDPGLPGWTGPYLKPSQIYDPWGRMYIYKINSNGYILISHGADGLPGGEGYNTDIYND